MLSTIAAMASASSWSFLVFDLGAYFCCSRAAVWKARPKRMAGRVLVLAGEPGVVVRGRLSHLVERALRGDPELATVVLHIGNAHVEARRPERDGARGLGGKQGCERGRQLVDDGGAHDSALRSAAIASPCSTIAR